MKRRKTWSLLLVAALVLFLLVGCATPSEQESTQESAPKPQTQEAAPEKATIAVVLKTLSSEYWNYVKAGCEAAADELDINVIIVGPNAETEIESQISMIGEQLNQKIDALVVAPLDESSVIAATKDYTSKMPVVMVDSDADVPGKASFVGTGNKAAAEVGGAYAAELIGQDGKAVIIYGQEGEYTTLQRSEGFQTALEAGGVEVIATQSGNNTTDGAMATMEDLLTRFSGEIDAVLCTNDDQAIGAMQACQQNNAADVKVFGFDGNVSAVELILEGKLTATVAQQPFLMGKMAIETAVKALQGETVEAVIGVDVMLVTKENAQAYLDNLEAILQ